MRHLWSFIAGLVAAPVVWVLLGLGQVGSVRTLSRWETDRRIDELRDLGFGPDAGGAGFNAVDLIGPAAFLTAAGVVLGLLAALRISPVGPLVAGLLLAAPYVAMFVDPFAVRDAIPNEREVFDQPFSMMLPVDTGTLLLTGVLLVMAGFSVQRWRRRPAVATGAPAGAAGVPSGEEGGPSAPPSPPGTWARPSGAGPESAPEPRPQPASEPGHQPMPAGPVAGRPPGPGPDPDTAPPPEPVTEPIRADATKPEPTRPELSPEAGPERPPEPEWPPPADKPADESADESAGEPDRTRPPAESPWTAPPRATHRDGSGE